MSCAVCYQYFNELFCKDTEEKHTKTRKNYCKLKKFYIGEKNVQSGIKNTKKATKNVQSGKWNFCPICAKIKHIIYNMLIYRRLRCFLF